MHFRNITLGLIFGWAMVAPVARANSPIDLFLDHYARNDFSFDGQAFKGSFSQGRKWEEALCDGFYQLNLALAGKVALIDFVPHQDGAMEAIANLENVRSTVLGSYQSTFSLCSTLSGAWNILTDWVHIRANVMMGEGSRGLKLKITQTEFGRIHIAEWIPEYFEDVLTDAVNYAMEHVWKSWLGDKISEKISEILAKQLPGQGLSKP